MSICAVLATNCPTRRQQTWRRQSASFVWAVVMAGVVAASLPVATIAQSRSGSRDAWAGGVLTGRAGIARKSGVAKLTGSMSTPRIVHVALLLTNGQVLVTGGVDGTNILASAELYNPATETWMPTSPMSIARYNHTLTALSDGKALVAGGAPAFAVPLFSAERYDSVTGLWTPTGSMANPREGHTATLLANGKVLVVGGLGISAGGSPNYLSSAEIYDPAAGSWTATGSLSTGRAFHTATLLGDGKVLVAGGQNGAAVSTTELYDPGSGLWSLANPLIPGRESHSANLLPNGKVLIAGGGANSGNLTNAARLYDAANGIWLPTGDLIVPRVGHRATTLAGGGVLLTGGLSRSGLTNSVELYDLSRGTWSTVEGLSVPRLSHSATLLSNGKVLIAGGYDPQLVSGVASAELYDLAAPLLPVVLTRPTKLPTGSFRFSFTNVSGESFTALAASNAALPLRNWTVLGAVTEITAGQYQFTDPQAPGNPQRFYQVRSP